MFSVIKDLVLSKLKNDYPVKSFKKNKISFIFGTIVNIVSASLIYLCLLFILKNLFNFQINRHTMQIIVFILEIIIIFHNRYTYFDDKIKRKNIVSYYASLFMYWLKNLTYNVLFVLPFFIAYGILRHAGMLFYVNSCIAILLLTLVTILISFILPNFEKSKNKVVSFFINVIASVSYIVIYYVIFNLINFVGMLAENIGTISQMVVVKHLINDPITILEFLYKNLSGILGGSIVAARCLFNTMIFSTLLIAMLNFISMAKIIFKLVMILYKSKSNSNFLKNEMIYNNIIVKRQNHVLRYCMPRCPTNNSI